MEYEVRDDMPDGAVLHAKGQGDVACVRLNSRCRELWPLALARAGLEPPKWVTVQESMDRRSAS